MYKICAITGSRADYGLLKNTLFLLKKNNKVKLDLVVTGSHLDEKYGMTVKEIIDDGFSDYHEIPIKNSTDDRRNMAGSVSELIDKLSDYLSNNKYDLFLVLGDRYEAYAACTAATIMDIPIAHISGGDVTEGAIDDIFRHCMTKMSSLHFTGCEQSKMRVIQMGENPKYVFNVGEPGVENVLNTVLVSREELSEYVGFEGILNDYALVTFHPTTMDGGVETALDQLNELIAAMKELPQLSFLVTLANADTAGDMINERWLTAQNEMSNIKVVSSLGVVRYLSAMKYCKFVLGNSSSGIVEAPSFKKPTVNIGDRQKGRMMAKSVINCDPIKTDIVNSIKVAISNDYVSEISDVKSPFGDGNTSKKIANTIVEYLEKGLISTKKSFYDITFEI